MIGGAPFGWKAKTGLRRAWIPSINGLGAKKGAGIWLAVMDMWKALEETSTRKNAPQAVILYDKFHVMRHLGMALDQVPKLEYGRLAGKDRSYIKGKKYAAIEPEEPDPGRSKGAKEAPGREQAPEQGLSAEGDFRTALGAVRQWDGHGGSSSTGKKHSNTSEFAPMKSSPR